MTLVKVSKEGLMMRILKIIIQCMASHISGRTSTVWKMRFEGSLVTDNVPLINTKKAHAVNTSLYSNGSSFH